jgi:hypothetical protein
MRNLFATIAFLLSALTAFAAGIGEWTPYLSYHNVTNNVPAGKEIYALSDGNLFVYDTETTEVRQLSKLSGLSDKSIKYIGYSATQHKVCVVYNNGNIDIIPRNGETINIPQVKSANDGSIVFNSLTVCGDEAVVATNDGFIYLDLVKNEIKKYSQQGYNVLHAAIFDSKFFIATDSEVRYCNVSDNFSDPTFWKTLCKGSVRQLLPFAGHLYIRFASSTDWAAGLWVVAPMNANGNFAHSKLSGGTFNMGYASESHAVFADRQNIYIIEATAPLKVAQALTYANQWTALTRDSRGTFWAANGFNGLVGLKVTDKTFAPTGEVLGGYGPQRDLCYFMRYEGGRLLIAGGRLDWADLIHYPGTLMAYENNEWTTFQEDGIQNVTGVAYRDITSIAQDPKDPTHHFASAGGTGIYEFKDYKFVRQYSLGNSPLVSAAPGNPRYVRMDGLNFDGEGNLWMVNNSQADTILRVLKPDGSWKGFYFDGLAKAPTAEKTLIDSKGRIWVASRRTVSNHDGGLLCFDNNGTVDLLSDDLSRYRSSVTNQDGTSYTLQGVYAMAEDHDGAIWVGTRIGLFVVTHPDEWFDTDFYVTQVKVPRNDGTNYADYLLNGEVITAIAVDGANRKWIGTEQNGIYLVSADGVETLHHFTTDNSPLLSNYIYSIAPNLSTGEIMIGTDLGLISYQSEASAPADKLSDSNLKVYPNPVRPEYQGNITLTGLTADADVKVVSTGGQLIYAGTSVGGTFTWDGRNHRGQRVASGVYYFMIATSDGKDATAAGVVVI